MKSTLATSLASLAVAFTTAFAGNPASACDGIVPAKAKPHATTNSTPTLAPVITSVSPCSPVVTVKTETLVVRLQTLVPPVSEKVDSCRDEVATAQNALCLTEQSLAAAEQQMVKTLQKIVAIKEPLSQKGCKVLVGERLFSRESVAEALRQSVELYKQESSKVAQLASDVVNQKKEVERLIAKVQRWEKAEKELLAEVSRLQDEQKLYFEQVRKNVQADAQRVATTIESMLETTKTPVIIKPVSTTISTSKEEQEVLSAVDSILQAKN